TFLAAVGITNYPVFGLITDGADGVVTLAWYSEKQDKIYVMERNVCKFILTSPLHAFQFATFLVRLRQYNQDLRALFKVKQKLFVEKARKGELRSWSKAAQAAELQQLGVTPIPFLTDGDAKSGNDAGGDSTIAVDNAKRSSEEENSSRDLSDSNVGHANDDEDPDGGANASDDNRPTEGASSDDSDYATPSEPDDPKDLNYEPRSR
ncbi:hypothetical protein EW146_g10296, partial [Bondarzewia mesenterica]